METITLEYGYIGFRVYRISLDQHCLEAASAMRSRIATTSSATSVVKLD